ncbi:MAG: FAD:protein FMN transferase [Actinomycetota bacterium]
MNVRHDFRAMGSEISLYASNTDRTWAALDAIRSVFEREERRFSRFRGDSELTQVNEAAGRWTRVSRGFEALVTEALRQAEATEGCFDPAVLEAIVAAGYDRDFDEVLAGARGALHPARPCGRWREIQLGDGEILLPPGVGLDLGGIAKGWTADLAAHAALDAGLSWALVSAGGDLRITGDAPELELTVEDPSPGEAALATLRLSTGALATSTTVRRAWGGGLHHVIDPMTGAPADAPLVQATVWAPTCVEAEVLATWALLTGPDAAATIPGVFLTPAGDMIVSVEATVAA